MPESTAVVEPSAEAQPQGQPEANANATQQGTEPQRPLTLEEKWAKGLKDLEEKDKSKEEVKGESEVQPPEKTETPVEDDGYVETVKYGDKEMALPELFEKAEFEVPFRGEMRTIEGNKLVELASIGLGAAQTNREAKEVVAEAQRIIDETASSKLKEVQDGVAKGVAQELERLLDVALSGTNPATNQRFASQQEKLETVDLLKGMKDASRANTPKEPALTADEIERRVEAKIEAKLKAERAQSEQQNLIQRVNNAAANAMQKATEPLMQHFVQEDGKTVNSTLFRAFQRDVQEKADKLWMDANKPLDAAKITDFINKASQAVLKDYRSSLRSEAPKPKDKVTAPVVRPSSGAPMPQATNGKKLPAKQLQDQRWAQAMQAMKTGR